MQLPSCICCAVIPGKTHACQGVCRPAHGLSAFIATCHTESNCVTRMAVGVKDMGIVLAIEGVMSFMGTLCKACQALQGGELVYLFSASSWVQGGNAWWLSRQVLLFLCRPPQEVCSRV